MARVTVEDCVDRVPNRFDRPACRAAARISGGAEIDRSRSRQNQWWRCAKIADGPISPASLKGIGGVSLQRVRLTTTMTRVDDIGSLSQSAEALRITAAAPVRNTSIGGDYDG